MSIYDIDDDYPIESKNSVAVVVQPISAAVALMSMSSVMVDKSPAFSAVDPPASLSRHPFLRAPVYLSTNLSIYLSDALEAASAAALSQNGSSFNSRKQSPRPQPRPPLFLPWILTRARWLPPSCRRTTNSTSDPEQATAHPPLKKMQEQEQQRRRRRQRQQQALSYQQSVVTAEAPRRDRSPRRRKSEL